MLSPLKKAHRFGVALSAAMAIGLTPLAAQALELVLVRADWCTVCEVWEEEVGVGYHKTAEAKRAPLRRVEYGGADLDLMELKKKVDTTPTFLLLDDDVEIARIEGYTADHFFWSELAELLKKAPSPPNN